MNDERLRDAYERGLPSGDGRPPLDDLAAERLRALIEREGSEADRLHTIDAQLSTAEGRRELEIAWAAARAARPRQTRSAIWAVAASVVMTLGAAGMWWTTRDGTIMLRGQTSPITLVAPVSSGERSGVSRDVVSRFIWRALPEADRYRLVVVDTAGNEVFAMETRDTVVTIPDTVRLEAGREYLWWVQASTRSGASITAVTQRVRIDTP